MVVLFIFRRDLRIIDNTALNQAILFSKRHNDPIVLAFVFTPEQTVNNPYFSERSFQFLNDSLDHLNQSVQFQMSFFKDPFFYKRIPDVRGIFFNNDYTPYARARDAEIVAYCRANRIVCGAYEDYTLHGLHEIVTQDGSGYKVFGAFYRKASSLKVRKPRTESLGLVKQLGTSRKRTAKQDMRADALQRVKHKGYDRQFPHEDRTSRLGPYIKFGIVSVREVYSWANAEFRKQLYWRDFYANIAYHYPHVLQGMLPGKRNRDMFSKFASLRWIKNKRHFERWCQGTTGVPIVDAGMRQLRDTGFMHNRLRMITASFLVKNLRIDWRNGERYFATQLIDYDPSSNNGGWQWVAGTGADAAPYFRVFNPWTQAKRFDQDAHFIKRYVPELRNFTAEQIHNHQHVPLPGYHAPMIAHDAPQIVQWYRDSFKDKNRILK